MKGALQQWNLADDVKIIGTEEEIRDAKADAEGCERLVAMELRARREIRNRLIASGLPDPQTGLSQVPEAIDLVPLDAAWEQSQNDLKVCEAILANRSSLLSLLAAHLNTVRWSRFWANQHPDRDWRQRFKQAAMEGEVQQDYILARFRDWEARQA